MLKNEIVLDVTIIVILLLSNSNDIEAYEYKDVDGVPYQFSVPFEMVVHGENSTNFYYGLKNDLVDVTCEEELHKVTFKSESSETTYLCFYHNVQSKPDSVYFMGSIPCIDDTKYDFSNAFKPYPGFLHGFDKKGELSKCPEFYFNKTVTSDGPVYQETYIETHETEGKSSKFVLTVTLSVLGAIAGIVLLSLGTYFIYKRMKNQANHSNTRGQVRQVYYVEENEGNMDSFQNIQ